MPGRLFYKMSMVIAWMACWLTLPSPIPAMGEENELRFQVQIGSAKDLDGTKWYASKASRVLNDSTYVIQRKGYYIVLLGYYQTQEQASTRLMEVRQHYNGMVTSYDLDDIIAAYDQGAPIPAGEFGNRITADDRKRMRRQQLRENQPIREVAHDEADGLRASVAKGLRNVEVKACTIVGTETLAGFDFRTSVSLADLDPYSLQTVEKHGQNKYIVFEARGSLHKIVTEQIANNKVTFTRKDKTISLKPREQDEHAVEHMATVLQELITFCAE